VPVNSTRPAAVIAARTVISFFVRVPVLSVQMTVVDPSVSTAESFRTMTLRRAILWTPTASTGW
jgi:hypothetical protein